MSCDVNVILNENPCLNTLQGFELEVLKTQLLCQIKDLLAGGSVGNQLVTYTSGTPANPTHTNLPALAYDPNGNLPMLGWNTGTLSWT